MVQGSGFRVQGLGVSGLRCPKKNKVGTLGDATPNTEIRGPRPEVSPKP